MSLTPIMFKRICDDVDVCCLEVIEAKHASTL